MNQLWIPAPMAGREAGGSDPAVAEGKDSRFPLPSRERLGEGFVRYHR